MRYRILGLTAGLLVWMTAGLQGQALAQTPAVVDQPGETSTNFQVLTQISGDGDGRLAGVTASGDIHLWNGKEWKRLEGQLHQVSMGSPKDLWGVNRSNSSVWRVTSSGWQRAPGEMSYVAVAKGGGGVVGIDLSGRPYYWQEPGWVAYPNPPTPFKQIEIGKPDAVYGIGLQDQIYKWHRASNTWKQLSGLLTKISVATDGTIGGSNSAKQSWIRSAADVDAEVTGSSAAKWVPQETNVADVYMIAADAMMLKNDQNLYVQKPVDPTLYAQPQGLQGLQPDPERPWLFVIPAELKVSPMPQALPLCNSLNAADQQPGTNCSTQILITGSGAAQYTSGGCVILSGTLKLNLPTSGPTPITLKDTPSCLTGSFKSVVTNTNPVQPALGAMGMPGWFNFGLSSSTPQVADSPADTDQRMAAVPGAQVVGSSPLPGLWSDYVGRSYSALVQNGPTDCQPTTFSTRSQYSWAEFRLPYGKQAQGIQIKAGSYNSPAYAAANRVWWTDLRFACDASTGWTRVSGDYGSDASGVTALPTQASPYLAYGHR